MIRGDVVSRSRCSAVIGGVLLLALGAVRPVAAQGLSALVEELQDKVRRFRLAEAAAAPAAQAGGPDGWRVQRAGSAPTVTRS